MTYLTFDQIFDSFIRGFDNNGFPVINKGVVDKTPFLEVAVTGIPKENIEVNFDTVNRILEIKVTKPETDKQYYVKQIAQRSFTREYAISDKYDIDWVSVVDGLLHIRFKESEQVKSIKRLEIN